MKSYLISFSIFVLLSFTAMQVAMAATMTITSPADGSTVSSSVQVTASAGGETNPISNMQIYDNGKLIYTTPLAATTLNTAVPLANGSHAITVKAWYDNGQSVYSTVNVNVSSSPTVTITSPANGSTVSSSVQVTASAANETDPISNMQIYDNGNLIYTTPSAATSLNTAVSLASGAHALVVKAWYDNGQIVYSTVNVNVSTSPTVTITSPANGSTVSGSVQVTASAAGEIDPISNMQIYDNGIIIYKTPSAATSLNTTVSLANGVHALVVKAWYDNGRYVDSTVNVTVSSSNIVTYNMAYYQTAQWLQCGSCGDSGGSGPTATLSITPQGTPSESGKSLEWSIYNASAGYANGYSWVQQPTLPNIIQSVTLAFDVYVPSAYVSTPNGIEFQVQQNIGGYIYCLAWQADYSGKQWRTWNYGKSTWLASGATLTPFTGNTWHHIVATYHISGGNIYYDSLLVDSVTMPISTNLVQPAFAKNTDAQFTTSFQLDTNSQGSPFNIYIDDINVSIVD
jgi:antitoxin component YwqK of YwqJK toxin-antitoxin module